MKKLISILIAFNILLLGCLFLPSDTIRAQLPSYAPDPCGFFGTAKSSVSIAIASATTTQLIALVAGKQIFVCGFSITMVGAVETIQFEYGTGAACGTGTTTITGAFADGTASDIALSYGGAAETVFTTIAGNALCAVTTGTVSIQGVLTYVQQ